MNTAPPRQPLILLPGLLCTEALWRHQIEGLADIADMIVPDLTLDSSIEDMADRALASAPRDFALAGLSMGGYVAQEIMRQVPDRVTHLALIDTSARADDETQSRRRQGLIAQVEKSAPDKFQGVTSRLLPLLIHPDRLEDPAVIDPIQEMAGAVGYEGYIRQQTAIIGRPDSRGDLAAIRCPTLVICGKQDALTPPDVAREIAEGIANARLIMIENCGHLATLEHPEAVTREMRAWLTTQTS